MIFLLALALPTVACLCWLLFEERRERIRLQTAHERQVEKLLNRIQMPEVAVGDSLSPQGEPEQGWVDFDNDQALAKELERLNGDDA